jgi:hypothetical protein
MWCTKIDARWKALPLKKQYRYILYCFISYLILNIGVTLTVWFKMGKANNNLDVEHIENPVVKKNESTILLRDSLLLIIKNRRHERK